MPAPDLDFPSTHRRTRLGDRRHGFGSARISELRTQNHENSKAYLSSVIAQGRPIEELAQISSMSNTLLIRSSTRERRSSIGVIPTRTRVSRARPQLLDEHWVMIVFGERRHPVQAADQRRPLSNPLEVEVNRRHRSQQAITVPSA